MQMKTVQIKHVKEVEENLRGKYAHVLDPDLVVGLNKRNYLLRIYNDDGSFMQETVIHGDFLIDANHIIVSNAVQRQINLGLSHPKGKLRFDLLPQKALIEVASLMGAVVDKKTYSANDWMTEQRPWTYYFSAACRHMWAWFRGEQFDPDTGAPHLACAISRLMMLIDLEYIAPGRDDRIFMTDTNKVTNLGFESRWKHNEDK
jgi:hypothetical protein